MRNLVSFGTALLGLALLIGTAAPASAVTVTINSPTYSSVNTSFTLNAEATSSNTVTGWWIYVDGIGVWNTPGPTSSISVPLTVSAGEHSIVVKAWDSSGASGHQRFSLSASTTGVTVSVQSPRNGGSVSSPVTIQASGSSANGISGWIIYVDGRNAYQMNNNSNSLTASVSVGKGSHSVYIRAWDKISGYGTSPTFFINVGSASSTSATGSSTTGSSTSSATAGSTGTTTTNAASAGSTATTAGGSSDTSTTVGGTSSSSTSGSTLPTPPSTATVFQDIQNMTGFKSCSANCAGGEATTNYFMAQFQGSPSLEGSSVEFFNGGSAWANVLWYKSLGANNSASHFLWDFYIYYDSSSIASLHTAEFDLYQSINGIELMVGSQCNFGDGDWNTWNQDTNQWINTTIPCKRFSPDTWHHVQWYVERVSATQYKYGTLVVDDTPYSVDQTYSGNFQGWADTIGVQWQLDLGSEGIPAHEWVDKARLTIW